MQNSKKIQDCSDWLLSDSTLGGDWFYFAHQKNAIGKADRTYRFFTYMYIACIEFYLQGLLPKICVLYNLYNKLYYVTVETVFSKM